MKPIRFSRCRRKRLGPRSQHIGRIRWKLFDLLTEAGLSIPTPESFWMQEGAYRSRYWDLARWGADWDAVPEGSDTGRPFPHSVFCWDTMTQCVRYGVEIERERYCSWEVHAKSPFAKPNTEQR